MKRRASGAGPMLPPNSRLFITGGTGFVGRSILRALKVGGYDIRAVTVLTRDPERFVHRYPEIACDVELVKGDVRDFAWPSTRFSHVIHGATDTSLYVANRTDQLIATIVQGTARVIDFALARGVRKMLFLSSGAVYGRQPDSLDRIPETFSGAPDPLDPASTYGNAKRLAEQLCANTAGRLETTIARLFAFVGEDLPFDGPFAIGNFIRDALRGERITVKGDGSPIRSYLYQGDLAMWLLTLLERGVSGQAYNVGSDSAVTIQTLAELVRSIVAPICPVVFERATTDYGGRLRYVPCIDKARNELGLAPSVALDDAIRRTVRSTAMRIRGV